MIKALEARRNPPPTDPLPSPAERKSLRERYGVTQQDVADVLKVSRLSVSGWERGTSEPTGPRRRAYAQLLQEMREALESESTSGEGEPS